MKYWLLLTILLASHDLLIAQQKAGPPARVVGAENLPTDKKEQEALRDLHDLDILRTRDKDLAGMQEIYAKPSKDNIAILAPSVESASPYAKFLKQKDTGMIKLNANEHCSQNAEVVSGDGTCAKYKIPGGGTAFSFRYGSYRILRLSDLILKKDVFKTDGVLQQGIMADLGDVPIESINADSKGLKFLTSFRPASTKFELDKMDRDFLKGVEADGYLYRIGFFVEKGHTYALRSIAFAGSFMRSVNGRQYDELMFDKRQDVLVTFKVIAIDPNGDVTIVWHLLDRSDAPRLKAISD
ncbi:MAG: hypothetical protein JO053_00585 [Acidobacteria bacterium]|nr:hypothetical protein [Acidobacteriota bacterium]